MSKIPSEPVPTPDEPLADDRPPRLVRIAGLITAAQGVIALAVAAVLLIREASGHREEAYSGYGTAAWFAIIFGGVLVGGLALALGRRWGRAISLVAQILLLPVAFYMITSDQAWAGVPLGLLALAVLVMLFSPSSMQWLANDYAPDAPEVTGRPDKGRPKAPSQKSSSQRKKR